MYWRMLLSSDVKQFVHVHSVEGSGFNSFLMYYLQPFTLAGDLTNEDFVRQLVDDTVKHYGKLDILVCIVDLI